MTPWETELRVERLPGSAAVVDVLRAFRDDASVVCLRGEWAGGGALLVAEPVRTAVNRGDDGGDDSADLLSELDRQPVVVSSAWAPERAVGGGWFGVLGYPLGRSLHGLPPRGAGGAATGGRLAFYDHVLRWDAAERAWWFETLWSPRRAAALRSRRDLLAARTRVRRGDARPYHATPFTVTPMATHLAAVERCIGHIRAGDIFQANIAARLLAGFAGSALDLFAGATEALRPAYAAYVADSGVVSLSPELFLRRRGRAVTSRPIKGTRPRVAGSDDGAARLRRSAKDAAENVMIVDLMRNDLSQVCAVGSVGVDALLVIEPHPGVWHLVSTVSGALRPDIGDGGLLRATFPPGSVTGAPKTRAMQVIDDCESARRDVFTGVVGFASPARGAEFSVAIRTFEVAGDSVVLEVGGGITVDSVPAEEWRECLTKAAPLLAGAGFVLAEPARRTPDVPACLDSSRGLLETILVRSGVAAHLADHLARLDRSCRELYDLALPADLAGRVSAFAAGLSGHRLRVVARPVAGGPDIEITATALGAPTGVRALVTARRPTGLWRHKYADRRWFTASEHRAGAGRLPLYSAVEGKLAETSRGNLFLVECDRLVTPPLTDEVLPGVTRRLVLDLAFDLGVPVSIEPVDRDRALAAEGMFTTSAIAGPCHIDQLDDRALPAAGAVELAISRGWCPHPTGS